MLQLSRNELGPLCSLVRISPSPLEVRQPNALLERLGEPSFANENAFRSRFDGISSAWRRGAHHHLVNVTDLPHGIWRHSRVGGERD